MIAYQTRVGTAASGTPDAATREMLAKGRF
ncbi:hypothetical protein [Nocardioides sp. B-3]